MVNFQYTVLDPQGLHARNAMSLCKLAETFESRVVMRAKGKEADLKNMMALMNLRVSCRDVVEFFADGTDEKEVSQVLESMLPTIL